jgi:hypothetical protein
MRDQQSPHQQFDFHNKYVTNDQNFGDNSYQPMNSVDYGMFDLVQGMDYTQWTK